MIDDDYEEAEKQYAIRPNKSALKRESAALEDLGEELIALPKENLDKLDLPPALSEAIALAQGITRHHGAYKRQRKFIAKLMREMDYAPIREQLDQQGRQHARAIHQTHLVERWRDRLLSGEDHELNALMAERPDADRQKLRQLIRDARKERETQAPPRSARLLFKYLRELLMPEDTDAGDAEDGEA
jgi:ribosome-associated protein